MIYVFTNLINGDRNRRQQADVLICPSTPHKSQACLALPSPACASALWGPHFNEGVGNTVFVVVISCVECGPILLNDDDVNLWALLIKADSCRVYCQGKLDHAITDNLLPFSSSNPAMMRCQGRFVVVRSNSSGGSGLPVWSTPLLV